MVFEPTDDELIMYFSRTHRHTHEKKKIITSTLDRQYEPILILVSPLGVNFKPHPRMVDVFETRVIQLTTALSLPSGQKVQHRKDRTKRPNDHVVEDSPRIQS